MPRSSRKIDRRARIEMLRHRLVGDSIAKHRDLRDLLALVREDERAKTLDGLRRVEPTAEDRA